MTGPQFTGLRHVKDMSGRNSPIANETQSMDNISDLSNDFI